MITVRTCIHYGIHFIGPLLIAFYCYKHYWKRAYLIMMLGFLIDLDHLWATPIFMANRCSINTHWLHTYPAIGLYLIIWAYKPTRLLGWGLVIHIIADAADCLLM